jgi:hypothetical protein
MRTTNPGTGKGADDPVVTFKSAVLTGPADSTDEVAQALEVAGFTVHTDEQSDGWIVVECDDPARVGFIAGPLSWRLHAVGGAGFLVTRREDGGFFAETVDGVFEPLEAAYVRKAAAIALGADIVKGVRETYPGENFGATS